jgi:AAA domain-containing protein/TIR domain-containing protein
MRHVGMWTVGRGRSGRLDIRLVGGGSFFFMEGGGLRRFFISYAHEDAPLLARFVEALEKAGHGVFFDKRVKLGSTWADELERELDTCDFFLLLLSENALASEMVMQEVERVRNRRRTGKWPLILTVRMNGDGPLPLRWATYLDAYQHMLWRSEADFSPILEAILQVAGSGSERPGATPTGPALPEDFRRPSPRVDLRAVVAPGGSMRTTDPLYIEREADVEVMDFAERAGETVVLKAPRQMGKSSLLKRYLLKCQQSGKRTALIDLSIFSDFDLADYSRFLTCLAVDLRDKLGLTEGDRPRIESQPDLMYFVEQKVLATLREPVVIAFDEVDRVLGQPYQVSFFSMLRYWHERRSDPGQEAKGWPRLDLALSISTEPYLLIDDAMRSPFNVRAPIELRPFTQVECRDLNARCGNPLSEDDAGTLHRWLGGQPFLTRLAYYHLGRKNGLDFTGLERAAQEDGGPFRDHLGSLLRKLRKNPSLDLLGAMKQVIAHGTAPSGAFERLAGAGLVRREGERILPANELYQSFFRAAA